MVELGAYLGYYSMNAANKIGPSGHLIAVEFVPENYRILCKNLSVNFPDNAQAILKGVSNKKGSKKIYVGGDQVNSFRQDIVSRFSTDFTTIEIETDTVDNILKENDINKVDLMVIQLNGNELDALMGMKDSMDIIDNFAIAAPYEYDGQSSQKIVDEFLRRNRFDTEVSDVWVYAKRKRPSFQKVGRNVCQPNCMGFMFKFMLRKHPSRWKSAAPNIMARAPCRCCRKKEFWGIGLLLRMQYGSMKRMLPSCEILEPLSLTT